MSEVHQKKMAELRKPITIKKALRDAGLFFNLLMFRLLETGVVVWPVIV